MADYIFEVPLSGEGRDVVTNPDVLDSIVSEGVYMIPKVTYNNLSVDSVSIDAETKQIYYGISVSPQMKLGLSAGDLAWWNTLLAGVAVAGAVVCVVVLGAVAIVPAAIVIGVALAYDVATGYVEVQATKADTKQQIAEAVVDGRITPEEGDNLLDGVNKGWGSDIMGAVKWMIILVGGAIALQMVLPMITKIGKSKSAPT